MRYTLAEINVLWWSLIGFLGISLTFPSFVVSGEAKCDSIKELPGLEQLTDLALKKSLKSSDLQKSNNLEVQKIIFSVKQNYYEILAREEQLLISKEVQGHFEKAIKKAEEKFENEDEEVTQSAITKLKLGLSGAKNNINKFNYNKDIATINLSKLLACKSKLKLSENNNNLKPVEFNYASLGEVLKSDYGKKVREKTRDKPKKLSLDDTFELESLISKIKRARSQLELARQNRKMTRALLVTEVANYDFGIGNEGDLFESLMIYTRVLVGYYQSIYEFNLAVAKFDTVYNKP